MKYGEPRPTITVIRPSKKKMFRQVWMIIPEAPHGGMRARLKLCLVYDVILELSSNLRGSEETAESTSH